MKKVLVIEDEAPIVWLIERLMPQGHDVIIMKNNLEAWSWLSEGNSCDLIISDLKMRSSDGLELLENVRNSSILQNIPFIILSGLTNSFPLY